MMVFDWNWDGGQGRYMLRVLHITPDVAIQVVVHPAVDCTLPRLYLPKKLRMECWLRVQYAFSVRSVNQTLDWIEEEVLLPEEAIVHDWSWYLDMLVATK